MKLKVLGCVSPICTKEDNLSGYLLNIEKEKILLDAGSGITRELNLPEDLMNLKMIITHLHADHYLEIYNLIYLIKNYKKKNIEIPPITLYIPKKPYDISFHISKKAKGTINVKKYNKKTKIAGINYNINFCKVIHSDIESYAVKVESNNYKFVYTGDVSNLCLDKLTQFSKDVNTILCDSMFTKENGIFNDIYHMTAYEASNYARLANADKLILTHFDSFEKDDSKIMLEAANNFDNIFIAKTGNEYNI